MMKTNIIRCSYAMVAALSLLFFSCNDESVDDVKPAASMRVGEEEVSSDDLVPAPEKPSGWQLVWYDNFDGTSLDTTKWKIGYPWGSRTHNHKGYAVEENAVVANGVLTLVAGGGKHGEKYNTGVVSALQKLTFDDPKVEWQVEARLKLADRNGIWPAFWLNSTGGWPNINEIDIMEQKGWGDQKKYETVMHFAVKKGDRPSQQKTVTVHNNLDNNWHTYAVSILKNEVKIKFDNKDVNNVSGPRKNLLRTKTFNIILNSAIGGDWGGGGYKGWIDDFSKVSNYQIDYVAIYKK